MFFFYPVNAWDVFIFASEEMENAKKYPKDMYFVAINLFRFLQF